MNVVKVFCLNVLFTNTPCTSINYDFMNYYSVITDSFETGITKSDVKTIQH